MGCCEKCYGILAKVGNYLQSPFLLLIRLIWGYQFILTGTGKLMNLERTTNFFMDLGISFPGTTAFFVGCFELLGGIALILGLGSRLMTIPLLVIMFSAYALAHSANLTFFSFATNPVAFANEQPFGFLYTVLVIFIFGPGFFSLDKLIGKKRCP